MQNMLPILEEYMDVPEGSYTNQDFSNVINFDAA
jgi:hypothetical protein